MKLNFFKIRLLLIVLLNCLQGLWVVTLFGTEKDHLKEDASEVVAEFDVTAQTPYLTIIQNCVQIIADKGIKIKDLESLKNFDINLFVENSLEELKKEKDRLDIETNTQIADLRQQNPQLDSTHYEYYKQTFRTLIEDKRRVLGYDKVFPIKIMSPPGSAEQAIALLNFIVDEMKIPADSVTIIFTRGRDLSGKAKNAAIIEQLKACGVDTTYRMKRVGIELDPVVKLSDDQTVFLLIRRSKSAKSFAHWRLIVEQNRNKIKIIEGRGDVDKITWDWKNHDDKLIKPGEYLYYFQWKKNSSDDWFPENPRKKLILVSKREAKQRVFLTKDGHPKYLEDITSTSTQEPMRIEIILNKPEKNRVITQLQDQ